MNNQGIIARLWASPYLLLTLAPLFWAGNFVVGRAVAGTAPPIALAFWRWTLALLPVLWLGRQQVDYRHEWAVLRANLPLVALLAVLGIACFNSFVYLGLRQTTALNAMLLQSMIPLLILLVCFVLYRERPHRLQMLGVVLSLAGVGHIATQGHPTRLASVSLNPGDAWVFAAVVAYAAYSALLRKRPPLHPLTFLAATFAIGALVLLPFYIREHMSGQVMPWNTATISTMAYLVIFPSILSYLFFNRGVELVGAGRAGLFIHLLPVFGSALAVVFLGERIEPFHLIGALLIAAGLVAASRNRGA